MPTGIPAGPKFRFVMNSIASLLNPYGNYYDDDDDDDNDDDDDDDDDDPLNGGRRPT